METVFFLTGIIIGLITGIIATFAVYKIQQKNNLKSQEDMYNQMQLVFENIANKIAKENTQDFTNISKERMNELLEPFKEKIEEFKKKFEENNQKFTTLDLHIKDVIETGNKITKDTSTLSQALKGDNIKQGKWGELILERVLELSALRKGEEYIIQPSVEMKRPDAAILLPDKKAVFIDAKTSLASYDSYINAETEEQKEYYLKQFKESTKTHISNLSKREYFEVTEFNSPEYVLMFIPIESCYSMLFLEDAQLWELAWKNKIMPVSPSTLLAALKIINSFNIVQRQNNNALEIASLAGKMIDKFAEMIKDLNTAQKAISQILTKLVGRGNIISQIEKLQELGAKSSKQIPQISDETIQYNELVEIGE